MPLKVLLVLTLFTCAWTQDDGNANANTDAATAEKVTGVDTILEDPLAFDVKCTTDTECQGYHAFSICDLGALRNTTSDTLVQAQLCKCNRGYEKDETLGSCYREGYVNERCVPAGPTRCLTEHSACRPDPRRGGLYLCQCEENYVMVEYPYQSGNHTCGRELASHGLTLASDTACSTCKGTCFDVDGDMRRDGCQCVGSRTGLDCEVMHVHVECKMLAENNTKPYMKICYMPHDSVNMSSASMYIDMHKSFPECRAERANQDPANPQCINDDTGLPMPNNTWVVLVSLEQSQLLTCGVRKSVSDDAFKTKFATAVRIQMDPNYASDHDFVFETYCESSDYGVLSESFPIGERKYDNAAGKYMAPNMTFAVYLPDSSVPDRKQVVPQFSAIRMGDPINLAITLNQDDIYSTLRIEECTKADMANINSRNAKTSVIIHNGCPAEGQRDININNNFRRRHSGSQVILETGDIRVSRDDYTSSANPVTHIECTVKLCLFGYEDQCIPHTCTAPSNTPLASRRRRQATDSAAETAQLGTDLFWYDPNPQTDNFQISVVGFAVLICVLIFLLAVFMLLTVCLYFRIRTLTTGKVADDRNGRDTIQLAIIGGANQRQPQRFAMPRINRTDIRT
jgi:hypothetical protein